MPWTLMITTFEEEKTGLQCFLLFIYKYKSSHWCTRLTSLRKDKRSGHWINVFVHSLDLLRCMLNQVYVMFSAINCGFQSQFKSVSFFLTSVRTRTSGWSKELQLHWGWRIPQRDPLCLQWHWSGRPVRHSHRLQSCHRWLSWSRSEPLAEGDKLQVL